MRFQRAAFSVLLCVLTVLAIIGGQFAVMQHFDEKRTAADSRPSSVKELISQTTPTVVESPEGSWDPFPESVRANPFAKADSHHDVAPPKIVSDAGSPVRTTAGEAPPFAEPSELDATTPDLDGPALAPNDIPEQLPHLEDAAPISDAQKRRDVLTRAIIAEELPNASNEERDVWFDQLKGLDPHMTRELLRLRTSMRTELPGSLAEMPQLPPIPNQEGLDLPPTELSPQLVSRPELRGGGASGQIPVPAIESSIATLRIARDVVLNNIANAHTTAFRRSRILFQDLPYQQIKLPGQQDANGNVTSVGVAVGFGVQVAGTSIDFSPGQLERTGNKLHLAIVGDGYFQVRDGSQILYTRSGTFSKNVNGELVLSSAEKSRLIEPAISVPNNSTDILISSTGAVSQMSAGSSAVTQLGQIQLARFVNSDGLIAKGENLFAQSDASGAPVLGAPEAEGRGTLKQGYLETSNVNVEEELAEARRLQSRLQALEQARAIMTEVPTEAAPSARIAETPAH